MTINEFLAAQGLTPEEIAAVIGNEKQAKAMTAALQRYEEGEAARAQAAAEKQETATFWESKTKELEGSVSRLTAAEKRAAKAEAEAAQRTAYLKSLKEQGYDVPEEMIAGAAAVTSEPEKPFTREEAAQILRGTAPDLVTLTALQARYQYLMDKPYIDIDKDFEESKKAGKSLRDYVEQKYQLSAKEAEKNKKAEEARIDGLVAEKVKAKEAELAEKYGSNPNLSTPMPSKFDRLTKQPGFKGDSWKSEEGRRANREARLKRFENIPIN